MHKLDNKKLKNINVKKIHYCYNGNVSKYATQNRLQVDEFLFYA